MDRFEWSDSNPVTQEVFVTGALGVRLYDGNNRTTFDSGQLHLTSCRLVWQDRRDPNCRLALPLNLVISVGQERGAVLTGGTEKVVLKLAKRSGESARGPVANSQFDVVKLGFTQAGSREFFTCLNETLQAKCWLVDANRSQVNSSIVGGATGAPGAGGAPGAFRVRGAGILGIERSMVAKQATTDRTIAEAFEDLGRLMDRAKEMVQLSKAIAQKIREKKGDLTDDETAQFKAHLLSMGIADPVTRDQYGPGRQFTVELARQLSDFLAKPLAEQGGVMSLADAYCRVNRARGMELLSPEDLVQAAVKMEALQLPVRLKTFDSGVMVFQLASFNESATAARTLAVVEQRGSISAEELSRAAGISTVLARERLLACEGRGDLCRDDTVEGLRFYTNLFNSRTSS